MHTSMSTPQAIFFFASNFLSPTCKSDVFFSFVALLGPRLQITNVAPPLLERVSNYATMDDIMHVKEVDMKSQCVEESK